MNDCDQPASFTCTACGECCRRTDSDSGVVMNHPDVQRLAAFLGMEEDAFVLEYAERITLPVNDESYEAFLLKFGAEKCRFLRDDNKCRVHQAKPMQCRYTPYRFFWDGTVDLWCMKNVSVPHDWTSRAVDDIFISGLRSGRTQHAETKPPRSIDHAFHEEVDRSDAEEDPFRPGR